MKNTIFYISPFQHEYLKGLLAGPRENILFVRFRDILLNKRTIKSQPYWQNILDGKQSFPPFGGWEGRLWRFTNGFMNNFDVLF